MKKMLALCLLGLIAWSGAGWAATLTGTWFTEVTLDPQEPDFSSAVGLSVLLTVNYSLQGWTFASMTELDEIGWADQDFLAVGVLGPFSLTSALGFDPQTVAFAEWNATAAVSIAGVGFELDFTLADNDVTLVLNGSGIAGDITLGLEVTFGGDDNDICDLPWVDLEIVLGFPFCCTMLEASVAFDVDGFEHIVFSAEGLMIPSLPYMVLDVTLEFTLQTKSLVLSPRFDFGAVACLDLYIVHAFSGGDGPGNVLLLEDITIEGVGMSCDIGGVTFTALSYWGSGPKPGLLAGTPYWEVYAVRSDDDGCCGPFGFETAVYFREGGDMLFDVSLIEAEVTLQVASQFEFNMGLTFDVELGAMSEWLLGFLVIW